MADDDIDDLLASLDAALEDFDDSTVDDITANNMSTDANTTGDDLDLNLTEFDDDLLASLEADLGTLDPSPPPSPIPSASPTDAKPTSSSMDSTAATSARSSEPVASAASTGTLSTSPDVDAELSQLLGLDEMTMHAPLTPGDSPLSGQSPRYPAPNLSPAPSSSPSPSPSPANSVTTSVASSSAASSVSRSQSRVEYTMDDEEEADDPRLVAARNVLAEYLDVLLQADAGSVKARARRKTMVNENEIRALCHTFLTSDLDVLLSQITSTPSKPLDMSSDTTQGGADDALQHLLLGKEKKSVQDFLTLHTSSKAKSSANAQQHMNLGIIPTRLRARVWTVLLGCHRKDERVMATWDGQLDLENQKVIRMDCDRTRPGQPEFERLGRVERDGAEVRTHVLRDRLERQLTFYCKSRGVGYKQGLNEIVAPFLVLVDTPEQASDDAQEAPTFTLMGDDDDDEDDDEEEQDEDKNRDVPPSTDALPAVVRGWPGEGSVFNMFYSMISKFLPSIFNDREFEYLQCIMRFFNLLLLYHDPGLCHFLDQHHILPELYATPWFITLFSRKLPLRHVFALWDAYIIEDDPFLHYFVALSLLIYNRKRLLRVEAHSLPQTMASLRFGSVATMKKMLLRAKKYRSRTPLSFRQRLFEVSFEIKDVSRIKAISRQVNDQPCMLVPAAELVQQCYHSMLEDGSIKFMILDCRPKAHFANGHLPCAMHLDPELLDKPEEMLERLNGFAAVKGCHFCFLLHDTQEFTSASSAPSPPDAASRVADAGYEPDVAKLFLSHFLQRGFSHLSLCEGGFRACHELVVRAKSELVDHCPDLCEVCTPGCHDQRSGRFSFGSAASRVKSMGSNLLTTLGNVRFRRASGSAEPEPTEPAPAPAAPAPADTPHEDAPDSGRRGSGIMARFTSLAKKKWPFKKRDQAEEDSASPARRPRSASSPNAVPRKSPSKRAPPAEANALIGTEEWLSDPSVQLFYCKRVIGRSASARGKVLVRVLVVTPVYIIGLEPKDMDPMPSDPPSDFDKAHLVRTGVLKSKNRISDLLKITRKKTMPRLLQFHWRPRSGSTRKSVQIYMVDRCDACIDVVTRHFAAFNST